MTTRSWGRLLGLEINDLILVANRISPEQRQTLRSQLLEFIESELSDVVDAINQRFDPQHRQLGRDVVSNVTERILWNILRDYNQATASTIRDIIEILANFVREREDLQVGIEPRSVAEHVEDVRLLRQELDDLQDIRQYLGEVLVGTDSPLATRMRLDIEAELGLAPSHRGIDTGVPELPANAASLARVSPELRAAIDRLFESTDADDVPRLARETLDLAGGNDHVADVVRQILHHGSGTRQNARLIAVLLESGRLVEGRPQPSQAVRAARARRSRDRPDYVVKWYEFEEAVTGSRNEWTGRLSPSSPTVGGTIGIDGINNGFVRDSKWMNAPIDISPVVRGRLEPRRRGGGISTPDQARRWQEHRLADEMIRQLQFARENNLRGIEWVVSSAEFAAFFQDVYQRLVRSQYSDLHAVFTSI